MLQHPVEKVHLKKKNVCRMVDKLLTDINEKLDNRRRSSSTDSFAGFRSRQASADFTDFGSAALLNKKLQLELNIQAAGQQLLQAVCRRDKLIALRRHNCDLITAYLHALSSKTKEEAKIRFSLVPGETGFSQWLDAMKMVAQLAGGMPPEFRTKLWLQLAEKHLQDKKIDWDKTERVIFSDCSNPDDEELGVQIVKDLHRTGCSLFCGEEGEQNQALLKRVLLAYARWNKAVGYCQGFNMLAAIILQVMDRDEQNAVKVMIYLIDGVLPESYFANNLRGLSVDMAVFRDLMKLRLPKLSRHLDALQQDTSTGAGNSYEPPLTNVFTMQWFLTLFSNCLPQPTVLRVWDLVFLHGNEILLRTAIAIWGILQDRVISVDSADEFYCIMGVVTREMLEFGLMDANNLVKTIAMVDPFPQELQELREKYLYNISPWTQSVQSAARRGFRLFHSDNEDQDDTEDEATVKALAAAHGVFRRRESTKDLSGPSLDIGILKKQYAKMLQRQRQAHVIISAACSGTIASPSTSVNHLLAGKSALVGKGRRIGPPKGAIPPSMALSKSGKRPLSHSPKDSGSWRDSGGRGRTNLDTTEKVTESTVAESFYRKEHKRSSSSSSSSTELCDEDGHRVSSDFDSEDASDSPRPAFTAAQPFDEQLTESIKEVEALTHNIEEEVSLDDVRQCALQLVQDIEERLQSCRVIDDLPLSINKTSAKDNESESFYQNSYSYSTRGQEKSTKTGDGALRMDNESQSKSIKFTEVCSPISDAKLQLEKLESPSISLTPSFAKEVTPVEETPQFEVVCTTQEHSMDSTTHTNYPPVESLPSLDSNGSCDMATHVNNANSFEAKISNPHGSGSELSNIDMHDAIIEKNEEPHEPCVAALIQDTNASDVPITQEVLMTECIPTIESKSEAVTPLTSRENLPSSLERILDTALSLSLPLDEPCPISRPDITPSPCESKTEKSPSTPLQPTSVINLPPRSPIATENQTLEKRLRVDTSPHAEASPVLVNKPLSPQSPSSAKASEIEPSGKRFSVEIVSPVESMVSLPSRLPLRKPQSPENLQENKFLEKTILIDPTSPPRSRVFVTKPPSPQSPSLAFAPESHSVEKRLSVDASSPRRLSLSPSMSEEVPWERPSRRSSFEAKSPSPRPSRAPSVSIPSNPLEDSVTNQVPKNKDIDERFSDASRPSQDIAESMKPRHKTIDNKIREEQKFSEEEILSAVDEIARLKERLNEMNNKSKLIQRDLSLTLSGVNKTDDITIANETEILGMKKREDVLKIIRTSPKKEEARYSLNRESPSPSEHLAERISFLEEDATLLRSSPNYYKDKSQSPSPTRSYDKNKPLSYSKTEWETKMSKIAELDSTTRAKIAELRAERQEFRYRGRSVSPSINRLHSVTEKKLKPSALSFDEVTSRTEKLLRQSAFCSPDRSLTGSQASIRSAAESYRDDVSEHSRKEFLESPPYVKPKDPTSKFKQLIEECYGTNDETDDDFPPIHVQAFSSPTSPSYQFRPKLKYSEFVSPKRMNYKSQSRQRSWAFDEDDEVLSVPVRSKYAVTELASPDVVARRKENSQTHTRSEWHSDTTELADSGTNKGILGSTHFVAKSTETLREETPFADIYEPFRFSKDYSQPEGTSLTYTRPKRPENLSYESSKSPVILSPDRKIRSPRELRSPEVLSPRRIKTGGFSPFPSRSPQKPKDFTIKLGLYPSSDAFSKHS